MSTSMFIDEIGTQTPEQRAAMSLITAKMARQLHQQLAKNKSSRPRGWAAHVSWKRLASFQWELGKTARRLKEIDDRIEAFKAFVLTLRNDRSKMQPSEDDPTVLEVYLGTVTSFDPCGKYHFFDEPPAECQRYWDAVREAVEEAGMWFEQGAGDPIDLFLCCDSHNVVETNKWS